MLFDKIFAYANNFSKSGELPANQLKKTMFGGSEDTKILRETSPEAATMMEVLTGLLSSTQGMAEEQKKEAEDTKRRMDQAQKAAKEAIKKSDPVDKYVKPNPYPENYNKRPK